MPQTYSPGMDRRPIPVHPPRQAMTLRAGLLALTVACAFAGVAAPAASAGSEPAVPAIVWEPCGTAADVTCTTVDVPRDYERPRGASLRLFVAKSPATDPARRIGTLFINFGGPGTPAASAFETSGAELLPGLNARFDIIAVDPRGVGQSEPSIDCKANQETEGLFAQPFTTPATLDARALVARDAGYVTRCLALNHDVLPYVSAS
jgi:hypothetical protein